MRQTPDVGAGALLVASSRSTTGGGHGSGTRTQEDQAARGRAGGARRGSGGGGQGSGPRTREDRAARGRAGGARRGGGGGRTRARRTGGLGARPSRQRALHRNRRARVRAAALRAGAVRDDRRRRRQRRRPLR